MSLQASSGPLLLCSAQNMFQIELIKLSEKDLEKVHQIDRSESVDRMYRAIGDTLEAYEHTGELASDPAFWDPLIPWWSEEIQGGAEAFGAFDGEQLTGIAIVKHAAEAHTDEIIAMYVSAEYRMSGIAKSLYLELENAARCSGAKRLMVSTAPTGSAIGFYESQGFEYDPGSTCRIDSAEEKGIVMHKKL